MKILILGGGYLGKRCADAWPEAILADKYINTADDVVELLDQHQPDVVLNAAGIVGQPNVDWCEDHQLETIKGNTILPVLIAEACQQKNIYLLHMGTGCVFYGQSPDPKGWTEYDPANPVAVYTRSKYAADLVLATLPNIGIARIRMPIDHVPGAKNLIDKLAKYEKIIDVKNSVTVIEDMIDVFYKLLAKQATGIFHVVNPGAISHKEILSMYEEIVDPQHSNIWITEEELVSSGLAKKKRSNNIMQSENLEKSDITMRPIKEAMKDVLEKYKQQL
jgi:3,5-epimerase/4-reductase